MLSYKNYKDLIEIIFDLIKNERKDVDKIIKKIEKYDIDVNTTLRSESLLEISANELRYDLCEYLLKNGANVNHVDKYGYSVIMRTSDINIMKLLIKYNIDLNIQDNNGNTKLIFIARNESNLMEKIKLLVENGGDLLIKNKFGDCVFDVLKGESYFNEIKNLYPNQYNKYLMMKKANEFNL